MDNKSLNQNFHEEELVDFEKSKLLDLTNKIMMDDDFEEVDESTFSQIFQSLENELLESKKMHISALNQQQADLIQSLLDEGIVNSQFRTVYLLKKDQAPSFYRDRVESSSAVDFDFLNMHCHKLKGSSACIGACTLVNGCSVFIEAVDNKSKDECLQAVRNLKQVYHDLHSKLKRFMELEKEIVLAEEGALGLR